MKQKINKQHKTHTQTLDIYIYISHIDTDMSVVLARGKGVGE